MDPDCFDPQYRHVVGLVINCDIALSEKAEWAEWSECDYNFPVHWVKSVRN